jgi:predicted RNA-binding protein with TRAM domain
MSYGRTSYSGGGLGAPKPVESGKEYNVEISEISRQGDGIARIQNFVIFVKGAKVGQKTKVRVTRVGDRFANADVVVPDSLQAQPQPETTDLPPE